MFFCEYREIFWDSCTDIDNSSGVEELDRTIFPGSDSYATLASEPSSGSDTANVEESDAPVSDDTC